MPRELLGHSVAHTLLIHKETGRFEGRLRYPGEDDVYEKPLLDRLGL